MLSHCVQLLLLLLFASIAQGAPRRVFERATFISNVTGLLPEYDYVIIGGGTSGLTVADRLTEDDNRSQ